MGSSYTYILKLNCLTNLYRTPSTQEIFERQLSDDVSYSYGCMQQQARCVLLSSDRIFHVGVEPNNPSTALAVSALDLLSADVTSFQSN